jgi:hypothetical protein
VPVALFGPTSQGVAGKALAVFSRSSHDLIRVSLTAEESVGTSDLYCVARYGAQLHFPSTHPYGFANARLQGGLNNFAPSAL